MVTLGEPDHCVIVKFHKVYLPIFDSDIYFQMRNILWCLKNFSIRSLRKKLAGLQKRGFQKMNDP